MIPNNEVGSDRQRDHDVVDRALRQSKHKRAPLTIRPAPIPRRFHNRKSIYRYCIARVIQRLAPRWSSDAHSLRRAVRNFLMPRRRNLRALTGLLHATKTASVAAALVLLLASPTAVADERPAELNMGSAPLPAGLVDVGDRSAPAFADLDADGDLDVLVGREDGGFSYFQNIGTATVPAFTSTTTPPGLIDIGFDNAPSIGDLDGDGDLDILAGNRLGTFVYFLNTGSRTAPAFVSAATPAGLTDVGYNSSPALGDLDGDGDLDVLAGHSAGFLPYFENTGSSTAPAFVAAATPADYIGSNSTLSIGDLDGDGDLDIVAGKHPGTFSYLANTGSKTTPAFAPPTSSLSDVGLFSRPSLGDLDGDGDLDVLSGNWDGGFVYFEHHAFPKPPEFTSTTLPTGLVDVGDSSAPVLADLDGDGIPDLLVGRNNGGFSYFRNTGSAVVPAFTSTTTPGGLTGIGSYSIPAFGDLDGDGDLDILVGRIDGGFSYFPNTGSATVPAFTSTTTPAGLTDIGYFSSPSFGDLDGDGDLDLVSGNQYGVFVYFENTGSATVPAFTSTTTPAGLTDIGYASTPALGDVDRDGDLDLLSGVNNGGFLYFENTGSTNAPAFASSTPSLNDIGFYSFPSLGDLDGDGDLDVLAGMSDGTFAYFENTPKTPHPVYVSTDFPGPALDVGDWSAPAFGDLDGDSDQDILIGGQDGAFTYVENTGSPTAPAYASAATPSGISDVGRWSSPAFGDLDGDGDLDLLSGNTYGVFVYFENTGSANAPAFTSSVSPTGAAVIGRESTASLGDLDGDGDLDLLSGNDAGNFFYFENTGSAGAPAFVTAAIPGTLPNLGFYTHAALADIDNDGDLDVLAGAETGLFYYFENTGSPTAPALASTATPAGLVDIGVESAPALADIDGDGDLDVLSGERNGTVRYFENLSLKPLPVIDGPERVAVPISKNGTPTPFELTLDASDSLGHELTWSIRLQASNGTAEASGTGNSRAITYTPDTDFTGVDVFIVKVTNEHGYVDTTTVVVHVFDPNDFQPLANSFTTLDTDNSDGLTLTEAQAQLSGLTALQFATLDLDNNGEITLDELQQGLGNKIVFVDFANNGAEDGTSTNPYNTLDEGITNVTTAGTIILTPGSTSETPTLNKVVTLQSPTGSTSIGN